MAYSEDHIALAAEYTLGTLDADERTQVETMMSVDKDYAALVQAWEFRLSVLNQMVGLVEPRPELWARIKAAIEAPRQQEQVVPEQTPPSAQTSDVASEDLTPPGAPVLEQELPANAERERPEQPTRPGALTGVPTVQAVNDNVEMLRLTAKARQWRMVANVMAALAAVLLAMIGVQVYRPELLPEGLRPKSRTQVAQVKAPAAQYVALLQKDGSSPAFILTVDAGSKNFTVRRVGAEPEPGKSYELWLVSDKLQRPRSLGVIGGNDFTTRPVLAAYDPDTVNRATFAVTLEPEGGSPTGVATGPIVFSGKLIETVPPAPAR
ncbi:conserved hypothetical protein [Bradyrhizobium sp. STM 3843]|uniref:anti-sigma factor n=1 Tax=Bradyrhizobium sp. STM 3843 TaxID=551947 RepID=UPI0002403D8A|nr:anti-sigma factor [Bradyrhizobium sp. STM 3843]CCE11545.1 conserved hypothetical protein [Bradyrhizobium sp. STM 3843]